MVCNCPFFQETKDASVRCEALNTDVAIWKVEDVYVDTILFCNKKEATHFLSQYCRHNFPNHCDRYRELNRQYKMLENLAKKKRGSRL